MKQFLLRFFAALGVLSTFSLLGAGIAGFLFFRHQMGPSKPPEQIVLALNLNNPITEPLNNFDLGRMAGLYPAVEKTPLLYILRALEGARKDSTVKGVVAYLGQQPLSFAHAQEIAAALKAFRESGKFAYVYGTSYGSFAPGGALYYLASHFEHIWLQPMGAVSLGGLGIQAPFARSILKKVGIEGDFVKREEYKSVMENMTRDQFSPPVRANMKAILQSLSSQIETGLQASLKMDSKTVRSLVAQGPYFAQEALEKKLVTKLAYEDEFEDEIKKKAGKKAAHLSVREYLLVRTQVAAAEPKGSMALIYADGVIVDDPMMVPKAVAQEGIIDSNEVVDAFSEAIEDKDVKAIIFRINSPGGAPVASERIRRAIIRAKEHKKPVFVSMGQVAASGGYWIAMDADRIFADGATLTGSIGVVGGKFVLGGLFDKIDLKWDEMTTEDNALMWSLRTPFTPAQRKRLEAMIDNTYRTFTENLSKARNIPMDKIPQIAKGRVFTGEQALKAGLVDEIGGLNAAIDGMKKHLGYKEEDKLLLRQIPAPKTPQDVMLKMLRNLFSGSMAMGQGLEDLQKMRAVMVPVIQEWALSGPVSLRLPQGFGVEGL
ncbi:MAG: signal peptide peptidase SppA [Alphaproteobacteria bacterium]|nr:signal peptide peptidase SppA [Alphaproteobacteria bacterium]